MFNKDGFTRQTSATNVSVSTLYYTIAFYKRQNAVKSRIASELPDIEIEVFAFTQDSSNGTSNEHIEAVLGVVADGKHRCWYLLKNDAAIEVKKWASLNLKGARTPYVGNDGGDDAK